MDLLALKLLYSMGSTVKDGLSLFLLEDVKCSRKNMTFTSFFCLAKRNLRKPNCPKVCLCRQIP